MQGLNRAGFGRICAVRGGLDGRGGANLRGKSGLHEGRVPG